MKKREQTTTQKKAAQFGLPFFILYDLKRKGRYFVREMV